MCQAAGWAKEGQPVSVWPSEQERGWCPLSMNYQEGLPKGTRENWVDSQIWVPGEVLPPGGKREVNHVDVGGRVNSGAYQLRLSHGPALPAFPLPHPLAPARTWHWAHYWSWLVVFQNKVLDVDGMKVKLQVRHLGEGELRALRRDWTGLTTGLSLSL